MRAIPDSKRRLALLRQAIVALTETQDPGAALQRVARLAVPVHADQCAIHIMDEAGHICRAAAAHASGTAFDQLRRVQDRYPIDPNLPVGVPKVLRTGQPELYAPLDDAVLVATARDAEHLAALRGLGLSSLLIVPILARGGVIGTLSWIGVGDRPLYTEADVDFASDLAAVAALALENARLYGRLESELAARERAAAALRESEARLRAIFEHAPVGMVISGSEYYVKFWNPACGRMLGYSLHELPGIHWTDITHPDDIPRQQQLIDELFAGRRDAYQIEKRFRRRDGSFFWGNLIVGMVRDDAGRPLFTVGIVEDITARREAEAALREREAQLREAQKMEAIGRLAGGIAHDFNNLLGIIIGYTELLRARPLTGEAAAEHLAQIDAAARRAIQFTERLLAFSRRQIVAPRDINLNTTLRSVEAMLRRLLGEAITLELRLDPRPCDVPADPVQIDQVLLNLVTNARDAMPGGGALTIETAHLDPGEAPPAAGEEAAAAPAVRLTVRDTGPGMDADTLARCFEPFFTTKGVAGSGLGLATVYTIVQHCGGRISVQSEPGRGTTFAITLPRVVGREAPLASPPPAAPGDGAGRTVLLVEDEPVLRALVEDVLRAHGYRVLVASDGPAALRLAEQTADRIDLLLSDVVMPGLGGRELAERLRRDRPDLAVLFMSGYTEDAVLRQDVEAEAETLLRKPFSPAVLLGRVRAALDKATT